ncbi:MAG: rRNA maturation RNase YbeY [Candidatus Omnitrophota bacterium]
MTIEILNLQNKVRMDENMIKKAAFKFLKYLKQPKSSFISLIFVSSYRIRRLNGEYFKKNTITDVIAINPGRFKSRAFDNYLGDIVICPQKAMTNSKRFNTSFKSEIMLYIAHGILHLLGYGDLKTKDSQKMRKKEGELVSLLWKSQR